MLAEGGAFDLHDRARLARRQPGARSDARSLRRVRAAWAGGGGGRFAPARRAGEPIPSRVQLVFHFEPPAPAATPPSAAPPTIPLPLEPKTSPPPPAGIDPAPSLPAALDVTVMGRR